MFFILASAVLGGAVGQTVTYHTKAEAQDIARQWCNNIFDNEIHLDPDIKYELFKAPTDDHPCSSWDGKHEKVSNLKVSEVSDFTNFFFGNKNFNGDISGWDVSSATDLLSMFEQAEKFNQDLNSWQTSKVTEMNEVFLQAYSFNGDITSWDTSKVRFMRGTFKFAFEFNQDIGGWDVGNVVSFSRIFTQAHSFYQPSIKEWNVMGTEEMKTKAEDEGETFTNSASGPTHMFFYLYKYNKDAKTVDDLEPAAGLSPGALHHFEEAEVPKKIACFWSDVLRQWTKRNRLFTYDYMFVEDSDTGNAPYKQDKICGMSDKSVDGEYKSYCTYFYDHCYEAPESGGNELTVAGLSALGGVFGFATVLGCLCSFRRSGGGGGKNYVRIQMPEK